MVYDNIAIGNRAYEARKIKDLKQADIGIALGIHQTTYSKFELGQYDMPISQIIDLCNLLDISVSWLIGENSIPELTDVERLEIEKYTNYLISKRKRR